VVKFSDRAIISVNGKAAIITQIWDQIPLRDLIRGKDIYFRILPKWWPATESPEPTLCILTESAVCKIKGFFFQSGKEAPKTGANGGIKNGRR